MVKLLWNEEKLEERQKFLKGVVSTTIGLQTVNPEIALVVGGAAALEGSGLGFDPVAAVIRKIEDTTADVSIMGMSGQITGEVTKAVSAVLYGDPGAINFNLHDYSVIGTDRTNNELTQMAVIRERMAKIRASGGDPRGIQETLRSLENSLKQLSAPRTAPSASPTGKKDALMPMLAQMAETQRQEIAKLRNELKTANDPEQKAKLDASIKQKETANAELLAMANKLKSSVTGGLVGVAKKSMENIATLISGTSRADELPPPAEMSSEGVPPTGPPPEPTIPVTDVSRTPTPLAANILAPEIRAPIEQGSGDDTPAVFPSPRNRKTCGAHRFHSHNLPGALSEATKEVAKAGRSAVDNMAFREDQQRAKNLGFQLQPGQALGLPEAMAARTMDLTSPLQREPRFLCHQWFVKRPFHIRRGLPEDTRFVLLTAQVKPSFITT